MDLINFIQTALKKVSFNPPLVFTGFQIFNKEVTIGSVKNEIFSLKQSITETKSITLPYSNSVLSFEFASLNYTAPEKKQYAYILEGFDKTWNNVGTSHIAAYTHLDPGKYLLKVKGLNNEGNWSAKVLSIQLIITPPFWLTWWFRLTILLAVSAGIILIYRIRIKNIKAHKLTLQQKVHEQTLQLVQSAGEEHRARTEAEEARHQAELANSELKIKNKELEQFAYVASHDLQEPLRTTAGFVKLLQKQYHGKLDDKADKYLTYISEASDRMRVLIKDLLNFSRIGKKGALEKVDCNIVIQEVLTDIMAAIQESGANINYTQLPEINGYFTEIKLLFQNLLINAIKFRRQDVKPQIKIVAKKTTDCWEFSISDNGIGIEQQYCDRIFDIFQRLHTRSQYAGSGIGLSHCKKIVEFHRGKIWVQSIPGEGSTFYFALPV